MFEMEPKGNKNAAKWESKGVKHKRKCMPRSVSASRTVFGTMLAAFSFQNGPSLQSKLDPKIDVGKTLKLMQKLRYNLPKTNEAKRSPKRSNN